ncbi:hypothetical protein QMK19_39825 [Streptomyces sp. H10-C2]|uniref:hypothetical protein n=1 Tax=unclassified Streptomyces TaxID=2593676 RepID=UPI0024B9E451|nr:MULTISPECIES: hypothetical protein [unclassified Streptomyces]MDJ0347363.1 hypothetical protein [Streptomyces sp. PH10-H1]MDJ0375573.1 hypothetical protein [Streptomyces sp. H10-C2]
MAEVLTWVMQRRIVLAERAGQLRKELVEIEAEVARLEAAEVVIGQFIEADRAGEADDPAMDAELERVTTAPGAGGMLLIPPREDGMDESALPEDYQAVLRVVAAAAEPVKAGQVSVQLGKGTLPGQVEAVRAKLKRLAERGWLHRTPAGRYTTRPGQ